VIDPSGANVTRSRDDGLATASLVTGIASILCCGVVTGVPAIIMGFVSRNRIARSSGMLGGVGLATAGLILGFVGSIVWTFATAFGIYTFTQIRNHPTTASAIPCDQLEHTNYHYHLALQIIDGGTQVPIPTDVGRPGLCFYWIHMHASSPGIIHVESPDLRAFTLGDFFDVWAKTSQQAVRLDSRHVGTITLSPGQSLVVFVDGQRYDLDPRGIPLVSHEVIQLEIAPPTVDPPPAYTFPSGF
jgi:Domain of unknown function (DUF4190)